MKKAILGSSYATTEGKHGLEDVFLVVDKVPKLVYAGGQALPLVKVAVGVAPPEVMSLQLVNGVGEGLPVRLVRGVVDLGAEPPDLPSPLGEAGEKVTGDG